MGVTVDMTWWDYLQRTLAEKGLTNGDLARAAGVDRSRLTSWRRGRKPSIETARAVATLFGVSPLEVMVAAQLLKPEEVRLHTPRPDPTALTDEQLLTELKRRLKRKA